MLTTATLPRTRRARAHHALVVACVLVAALALACLLASLGLGLGTSSPTRADAGLVG